ncbi:MAG: hypothetical protein K8J31_25120 [Anaerolineae bacterium]|nr:hypothetical protein [Anaerolineae bacterium]
MNLFLEPPGFLGTGASFLADVTLIAYILLLAPAMIAGWITARRGLHRPHHKWLMIAVTVVNWVLIAFLMWAALQTDVAPNVGSQPTNPRYLLPSIHALFGLPAQLLATYIVIRMLMEDIGVARARRRGERDLQKYWYKAARWTMRLTLILWLLTTSLGIFSYITRYNVIKLPGAAVTAPASTPEADSLRDADTLSEPAVTPEVSE